MDELINYNGYEEFKQAVNRVLNRTVEDFVLTGYLLKQARDTDILKDSGYNDVNEFAWGEYKLDASQVSRYIRVNDKFSEGGYSPKLQEQYQGFGYAKLALMLTLPEEVAEELTPAYSKTEIQAVKEEIEEEEKITDIEVILEGEKEEQKNLGNLEKALHQIFHDEPELYKTMHETVQPAEQNICRKYLHRTEIRSTAPESRELAESCSICTNPKTLHYIWSGRERKSSIPGTMH